MSRLWWTLVLSASVCNGAIASDAGSDAYLPSACPNDAAIGSCFVDAAAVCPRGTMARIVGAVCDQLNAPVGPGPCPPGHVGCCAIGQGSGFELTECVYPPLDAAICAQADGSFTANGRYPDATSLPGRAWRGGGRSRRNR